MPKLTKAEAQYGQSNGGDRCADCKWFEHSKPNACEIVEGEIRSSMWCRFFADATHRRGSRLARSQDRQRKEVARMRGKEEPVS